MARQKRAVVMLHDSQHYQREAFAEGLARHGFDVTVIPPRSVSPVAPEAGDALVCWNVQAFNIDVVKQFEAAGAAVLVAENGYIGQGLTGEQFYALARGHHNGAGWWPWAGPERLAAWEKAGCIAIHDWRDYADGGGGELVIVPQRSIGEPGVAMPRGWLEDVQQRLAHLRPVVRRHPGTIPQRAADPIEAALKNAHAVVTWGSGGAIKALALGIPVFYEFGKWIGGHAARFGLDRLWQPKRDDAHRRQMFERLAWAQWSIAEIRTGIPFEYLLPALPADWHMDNAGMVRSPGREPLPVAEAQVLRDLLSTRSGRYA